MRPDLGRDGGARRLHLREILFVLLALRADGHEEAALVRARGRQGVLADDESVAGGALLLGLACEDGGRLGHVALRRGRHHAGEAHLARESLQVVGELLVRIADRPEVVDLLDQLGKAVGLEENVELVGVGGLVELDQPRLQLLERDLVVAPQQVVALRLLLVLVLQALETRAVDVEVLLERGHLRGQRADVSLEGRDLRRRARDLGREDALLVLRVRDLALQACDLRVEALLLLPHRLAERGGDAERHAEGEYEGEQREATKIAHENEFRRARGRPCARVLRLG